MNFWKISEKALSNSKFCQSVGISRQFWWNHVAERSEATDFLKIALSGCHFSYFEGNFGFGFDLQGEGFGVKNRVKRAKAHPGIRISHQFKWHHNHVAERSEATNFLKITLFSCHFLLILRVILAFARVWPKHWFGFGFGRNFFFPVSVRFRCTQNLTETETFSVRLSKIDQNGGHWRHAPGPEGYKPSGQTPKKNFRKKVLATTLRNEKYIIKLWITYLTTCIVNQSENWLEK